MNRLLIGITGQRTQATKEIIHVISQELNLININMRQPFINVLAAVTSQTPQTAAQLAGTHPINELKCSVAAFERSFLAAIYELNANYFIDVAELTLARSTLGFTEKAKDFFSGHIISGITKPSEVDFIRKRGGMMIHINQGEGWTDFYPLHTKPDDLQIDARQFIASDRNQVKVLISRINTEHKKAA